ncbi:MAG: hypothetical protein V1720_22735 [bacterium]
MLSLHELRFLCMESLKRKPTFRALLQAAAIYDKEAMALLFYNAEYSLSAFVKVIKNETMVTADEEQSIITTIKNEAAPSALHLLRWLCITKSALSRELEKAGLNLELLLKQINILIMTVQKNNVLFSDSSNENPLTNLSKCRFN